MIDRDGADCYRCTSATGEVMHLWLGPRPEGYIWAWLQQGKPEPIIVTRDQVNEIVAILKMYRRMIERGLNTDVHKCVIVKSETTGLPVVLTYGIANGHLINWRDNEPHEPIPIDLLALTGLIEAWQSALQADATATGANH